MFKRKNFFSKVNRNANVWEHEKLNFKLQALLKVEPSFILNKKKVNEIKYLRNPRDAATYGERC